MNESAPMSGQDDFESGITNADETIHDEYADLDEKDSGAVEDEEFMGIIEIPGIKSSTLADVDEGTNAAKHDANLSVAFGCSVGAVRQRNEDSCLVFSTGSGGHFALMPFGLYIVADGMGGHTNGHVASKTASRVAARYILERIYLPLLHDDGGLSQTPIQEVLVNAVQAANTAVFQADLDSDSGTTLTIALVLGRRLHVAHVGDSRLYLLADNELRAVTSDHSLVQRLQDVGQPADDITFAQIRHVLLRAVGQVEEVEVDTYMRLLPRNGKLLLCTDGLCGPVSNEDMQKILEQNISLEQMVNDLTDAAMKAGGYDNITAIVVDFVF
ncbi:MAG: serine/threonine-protein phosphatase [Ardenticatenaceae bacterium]|nr:serine/threonine-protein phosphatase [Ardenticatenaceae bacterium]MCB9444596.1 serine/threonine-protein phosphatase [Ardenticatenaceae bacterium]